MKRLVAICLVLFAASIVIPYAFAADRVVVIPLGGAVGDAVPEDVVRDKTFSSQAGKGLTGTRFPALLKKSGQTTDWNLYDSDILSIPSKNLAATFEQKNNALIVITPSYYYDANG